MQHMGVHWPKWATRAQRVFVTEQRTSQAEVTRPCPPPPQVRDVRKMTGRRQAGAQDLGRVLVRAAWGPSSPAPRGAPWRRRSWRWSGMRRTAPARSPRPPPPPRCLQGPRRVVWGGCPLLGPDCPLPHQAGPLGTKRRARGQGKRCPSGCPCPRPPAPAHLLPGSARRAREQAKVNRCVLNNF